MSESFEFQTVSHFTAGAVGQPGERVFYLQAGDAEQVVSIKIEKQQVAGLAGYLETVLEDLPAASEEEVESLELIEPALPEWVVGQIAVGVDESQSRVVLVIEELIEEPDEPDELFGDMSSGASLRVQLSVAQATSFITTAARLMKQGRPPCRLCGQPETPGGHSCPRLN